MWFAFTFWCICCNSAELHAQHRFLLSQKKTSTVLLRYSRSLTREMWESWSTREDQAGEVCGKCAEMWKPMASTRDHLLIKFAIKSKKVIGQLLTLGPDLSWGVRTCSGEKTLEPFAGVLHLHPCPQGKTCKYFACGGKAVPVQPMGTEAPTHSGGRHSTDPKSVPVWEV